MNYSKDFSFLFMLVALAACLALANKYQHGGKINKHIACTKRSKHHNSFDPIKQASPINFFSAGILHLGS